MIFNEALEKIINHYGMSKQLYKATEELAELIQALCKWAVTDAETNTDKLINLEENIIEEMADVQIMLEQLKIFFAVNPQGFEEKMKYKIDRTLKRIKEE